MLYLIYRYNEGEINQRSRKINDFQMRLLSWKHSYLIVFIPNFKIKEFSNYTLNNYCLLVLGITKSAAPSLLVCYARMMSRNRTK